MSKLVKNIRDLLALSEIEENKKNIVESLMKMEMKVLGLVEARNHLVDKDVREKLHLGEGETTVMAFEKKI